MRDNVKNVDNHYFFIIYQQIFFQCGCFIRGVFFYRCFFLFLCRHLLAIHWFDFDSFYKEVSRVAKPGALIAAWTYTVLKVNPEVDKVIDQLYWNITRPYWDKERDYVDAAYRTIPFPFEEIPTPKFQIIKSYTLPQLIGYLRTWSGVKHYLKKEQRDPVSLVLPDLEQAWGGAGQRQVHWPVSMRTGRVG
jgi:SAM-dependent methyltransferase